MFAEVNTSAETSEPSAAASPRVPSAIRPKTSASSKSQPRKSAKQTDLAQSKLRLSTAK